MTKKLTIILLILVAATAFGCRKEIGDSCGYDIDCSPNMDRNCDRSQPGGYCLILGCDPDDCPGEAACVEFTTPCPVPLEDVDAGADEDYDAMCEQIEPNRGRSYCLRHCNDDGDCRSDYWCADPGELDARIIDLDPDNQDLGVCVPIADNG